MPGTMASALHLRVCMASHPLPPAHLPAQEPRSSSQIIPSQGLSAVLASCLYFSSLRPLDKVGRNPVQTRRSSVSSPNTAVVNSGETGLQRPSKPGVGRLVCKGPENRYFRLCPPFGLCHNHSTLPLRLKAVRDTLSMNGSGCVPIKLYLQKSYTLLDPWATVCQPLL